MQVSIETLEGLERKITVSVPSERIDKEVSTRLKNLAQRVKVDGFRPGKVPLHVVKSRYSAVLLDEVAREVIQSSLYDALKEKELTPAGMPHVEPQQLELNKDFIYSATFEVFPAITLQELNADDKIEIVHAELKDADLDRMIERLREQHKTWAKVDRAAASGDKIMIDFEGFFGDAAFEGGHAENYGLVIGSGNMIPGFEDHLIGAKSGQDLQFDVTFPEDYHHDDFAGKLATFKVKVNEVLEGTLPALDDAFAASFNITSGGVDALREDIKGNMQRELTRRLSMLNRDRVFEALLAKNIFDVPLALIDEEIKHLKHEMYHQLFGNHHSDDEKIPDFPRQLFEERAQKRTRLGLLFSEYVKHHALVVDKARVDAMIASLSSAFDNPEEASEWYHSDKTRIDEIESLVMEEMATEKMMEQAHVTKKEITYEEAVSQQQNSEHTGD